MRRCIGGLAHPHRGIAEPYEGSAHARIADVLLRLQNRFARRRPRRVQDALHDEGIEPVCARQPAEPCPEQARRGAISACKVSDPAHPIP